MALSRTIAACTKSASSTFAPWAVGFATGPSGGIMVKNEEGNTVCRISPALLDTMNATMRANPEASAEVTEKGRIICRISPALLDMMCEAANAVKYPLISNPDYPRLDGKEAAVAAAAAAAIAEKGHLPAPASQQKAAILR